MDAPITKRLIVSGLTPAISAEDISRRLTTFGTVKAADGFGLPDGVGQPRKFGYVTLETTVGKLSKCMNLLSGSTWKGAKLRFGEAKPDFAERIALENRKAAEEPPKKKRVKRNVGVYGEDMSLVTSQNAAQKSGWKVSSLGRITTPVKMRPSHPLIEPVEVKKPKKTKTDDKGLKKKKRIKDPDSRARRKTIDMTKYGSTHLKGMWLDLEVSGSSRKSPPREFELSSSSSSSRSSESDDEPAAIIPSPSPSLAVPEIVAGPSTVQQSIAPIFPVPVQAPQETVDISQEKSQTLNLLNSLFGQDDDDWIGQESVGSDIDADELVKGDKMLVDDDRVDFEIVPKNAPLKATQHIESDEEEDEDEDARMDIDRKEPEKAVSPPKQPTLKDLFAPREDEGGFSLLGHLDLDIELDEDAPFLAEDPIAQQSHTHETYAPSIPVSQPYQQSQNIQAPLSLNPRQALFFPLSLSEPASVRARQRDVYDIAKDNGWNWRDPAVGFYRTGTEEDIKKRWEESKGDLTRDWKRRSREAGKVNRRKRGGVDDAEL
ncbi:Nucleolar protein 8 [Psilocybe cubensis]|uniref:Nucleolar protein 8 n=2 Tax=Psilocybe cubensis TaxID=181762 RepID=A0ACB8GUH0_PSICU|nr:Nucleolar protein 8 [Psilocybe cubensis]KAH9479173.1 Nucleolar protein 8 [Psilocybe cubensis]